MKRKKEKVEEPGRIYRSSFYLLPFAFSLIPACADTKGPTSRPMSAQQKQDAALKDPFGYGPKSDGTGSDVPNVSGGGIGDFDRKAFDRDLDRVLGR